MSFRLLKRLQNSNPTYSHEEYETQNKMKNKIIQRMCNYPYILNQDQNRRSHSKVSVRRNLSISQSVVKKSKHHDRNLSQNSSSNHMLRTTGLEDRYHEETKEIANKSAVLEADESAEIETAKDPKVFGNITIVPNSQENPQSVNNSIVVCKFV